MCIATQCSLLVSVRFNHLTQPELTTLALWLKHNEIGSDGKIGLRHPAEVRAGPELNMPDDPHY